MPLVKKSYREAVKEVVGQLETNGASGFSQPITAEVKPVYTGRKASSDTMSKEDWANKDKRISLQGLVQALLQSVNFGQYVVTTTPEEFLLAVEQASLRLAKFVAENGK